MSTYTVKKRLVSVGRDYDVFDETGTAAFTIDGKVRFGRTFDIKDPSGQVLFTVKEKLLAIDRKYEIDGPAGTGLVVHKTNSSDVGPMKFEVEGASGPRLHAEGNFIRDGFAVKRGDTKIASVSREQRTVVAEIFHVWTADGEDVALMLAITMAIVETDRWRGQTV